MHLAQWEDTTLKVYILPDSLEHSRSHKTMETVKKKISLIVRSKREGGMNIQSTNFSGSETTLYDVTMVNICHYIGIIYSNS